MTLHKQHTTKKRMSKVIDPNDSLEREVRDDFRSPLESINSNLGIEPEFVADKQWIAGSRINDVVVTDLAETKQTEPSSYPALQLVSAQHT